MVTAQKVSLKRHCWHFPAEARSHPVTTCMGPSCRSDHVRRKSCGMVQRHLERHGSKLKSRGYAGVGPCFHLPGFHFGTGIFSHSHKVPFICELPYQVQSTPKRDGYLDLAFWSLVQTGAHLRAQNPSFIQRGTFPRIPKLRRAAGSNSMHRAISERV